MFNRYHNFMLCIACDNLGLQIIIVHFVATPGNIPDIRADTSHLVLTLGGSGFPGKIFCIIIAIISLLSSLKAIYLICNSLMLW